MGTFILFFSRYKRYKDDKLEQRPQFPGLAKAYDDGKTNLFVLFSLLFYRGESNDKTSDSLVIECLQPIIRFVHSNVDDIIQIYWPTTIALGILYIPIFLLSILNHSISNLSKWFLTLPIVFYLLFIPTCLPVRAIPLFGTCVGSIGIYYAQKVCEWILVRRNEFSQWSFLDIHHELFHYRVYTHPISVRKFEKNKKEIFFTGPIEYQQHRRTLFSITCNIIKYYLLLDLSIYITSEAFSTEFHKNYYEPYLFVRILINQLSGCIVFLLFTINYELFRCILCLVFNRPLALMPDLFRQPYLAVSPTDFWSRWHHVYVAEALEWCLLTGSLFRYRYTWIELIFKPVSQFLRSRWPKAPTCLIQSVASICIFIFSGLMHEYFVYVTFHKFSGDQVTFFVIQGLAVLVEAVLKHLLRPYQVPRSAGFVITFTFNGITAGYFIQPWISYFNQRQKLKYSVVDLLVRNVFWLLSFF